MSESCKSLSFSFIPTASCLRLLTSLSLYSLNSSKMLIFSSYLLLLFILTSPLSSTVIASATHNRRTLHQPFFPQDSVPPTEPPSPTPPAPKIPFSTTTTTPPNEQPFFPSFPSPPPPPPSPPATSFASFPANISSLSLPQSPKSNPVSSKLIATAIAAVLAAAFILALVVFLHIRKKKQQTVTDDKTHRSETSNGFINTTASNGHGPPKMQRSSQSSSEFLYLGTLVNSHSGIDSQPASNRARDNGSNVNPRKLDSPELRPLPPLSGQIYHHNYENAELDSSREEDLEEFYSPRGSLGGRDSSIGAGSASRRAFAAVAAENFESRRMMGSGTSSYSTSSSGSGSPARSVSLSISPPVSPSPINSRPKSPELVAIQTAPPSRPPPPPPPTLPRLTTFSPSPPILSSPERESSCISSSPERDSRKSQESSQGLSIFYPRNSHSPPAFSNSVSIPPPPPPPPPPLPAAAAKDWGSPRTPTPVIRQQFLKPPVLITPSRPGTIQSGTGTPLVSPMELPAITASVEKNEETPKPKLKPLHWDKVRASSDREMVWDQLKSSSFKLDEEMIETLFIVKTPNSNQNESSTRRPVLPSPTQENRVLDPKKSQNIAISLRALNVTIEEVCEALSEGNAETLGTELLESLLKMAPTKEEERKLIDYKEDSPFKLGPAEKFLKVVLDIPFAFKRVDAMLYVSNFDSEVDYLKRAFGTLEAACEELRNNRMFLKLLEAVLKTGNRMNVGTNRGDAHAFKLDTLLKLVDVKGADGKTTLLHFVVQEIIRSEGARLSNTNQSSINDDAKCRKLGLQVVSGLSSDLTNVKKAAAMDSEVLNGDVSKLSKGISNIADVVRLNEKTGLEENSRRFSESMNKFMKVAEEEIIRIQAQESVALSLVKEITEYFHGNSAKEEAHPFRIFMVVRDFLTVLDRVCKEVGTINERTIVSTAHKFPVPVNPTLPAAVFSEFPEKRQYSWSDEEGCTGN